MRIIAGAARGRRLKSPSGAPTRPMTDRAREGLFSSIAAWIRDADVLDLYAGSGSLGLEALSRGAASATFVEQDRAAVDSMKANVEMVGLGGRIIARPVEAFLSRDRATYDIVFVDPPYAMVFSSVTAIMEQIVPRVRDGGLVVLHRRVGEPRPLVEGLAPVGERAYGTAQLWRFARDDLDASRPDAPAAGTTIVGESVDKEND